MNTPQATPNLFMPVDLAGQPLKRQVEMGENLEALLEHPGFADLCEVLKTHREGLVAARIYRKPDPDGASYADLIGHLRGLSEIEPIARGVVENGKAAAAEQRRDEQRGT